MGYHLGPVAVAVAVAVAVGVGLDMAGSVGQELAAQCRVVRTSWALWGGGMSALPGHGAG